MLIILGSSSKFRQRLLIDMGYTDFISLSPDIDEYAITLPGYTSSTRHLCPPDDLVLAIARAKAQALITSIQHHPNLIPSVHAHAHILLITCDQVIWHHGQIREKPLTHQQCRQYLHSYTQTTPAQTHSSIVITNLHTKQEYVGVDVAKQYFKPIPDSVIDALLLKGDVMHCAGGFMIDDPLLEPYLDAREGEQESIIGLPKTLLKNLLQQAQADFSEHHHHHSTN